MLVSLDKRFTLLTRNRIYPFYELYHIQMFPVTLTWWMNVIGNRTERQLYIDSTSLVFEQWPSIESISFCFDFVSFSSSATESIRFRSQFRCHWTVPFWIKFSVIRTCEYGSIILKFLDIKFDATRNPAKDLEDSHIYVFKSKCVSSCDMIKISNHLKDRY